jgi:hypothetical protein
MISRDMLQSEMANINLAKTKLVNDKTGKEDLCRSTQQLNGRKITCSCPKREIMIKGPKSEDRDAYLKNLQEKYGDNPSEEDLETIREKLSDFLKREFRGTAFNQCETQALHTMKVKEMKVNLKEGAEPVNYSKTYPVPINLKDEVKQNIDMAVSMGILEPVPCGELTLWCAPMLAMAKKLRGVRRVINYKALNKLCN